MGVGYPLDLVVCVALGADMYVQYIPINENSVFMLAQFSSFDLNLMLVTKSDYLFTSPFSQLFPLFSLHILRSLPFIITYSSLHLILSFFLTFSHYLSFYIHLCLNFSLHFYSCTLPHFLSISLSLEGLTVFTPHALLASESLSFLPVP